MEFKIEEVDFKKSGGLVPAIIQDVSTNKILMLGYMNKESLQKTLKTNKVTFYSRSRKSLWTKGETSNNFLHFVDIKLDCDNDALLVKVMPDGPTCHTGSETCWNEDNIKPPVDFINKLQQTILNRKDHPTEKSYTSSLLARGINKVAQKVGEEAIELVIEAKDDNKDLFLGEAADLMYHYLVLLAAKDFTIEDVISVLKARHK